MIRFLTHIIVILVWSVFVSVTVPAIADDKERELTERVFEKYKQREAQKQQERKARSERSAEKSQRDRDSRRSSNSTRDRSNSSRDVRTTDSRKSTSSRTSVNRAQSSRSRDAEVDENDLLRAARELDRSLQRKRAADRAKRDADRAAAKRRQEERRNAQREPRRLDATTTSDVATVSLDQAVDKVRRASGGRVLSATTSGQGSSRKHKIKVMIDDRRIRTYIVDATSGRIY